MTSSDIVADTGIAISGQDVTLDAKANETHEVQTHEEKSSGLTLSLGGVVGNTITAVSQQVSKAKHRDDKRLTALELVESGQTLDTAVDQAGKNLAIIKNMNTLQQDVSQSLASVNAKLSSLTPGSPEYMQTLQEKENLEGLGKDVNKHKRAAQDNLVQINVSLGSQKSKQVFENNTVEYVGGTLVSNGTIDIEAKSAADTKGSIKAIAETIKGKTVNLSATKDISLEAAENTYDSQFTNTSSGWSVGTSISPVSGMSPNVNVGLNKAKEDGNTHQTSHTGTKVVGTESVTIQSGQDTNITGSQVQGETVRVKVGKDLNITSLQDVNDYTSNTKTAGLNLSTAPHMAPILSGSLGRQTIDSQYKSVIEQAGIHAGDSGLSATVGNTTQLRGASIDAKGSSHLKTKNLEVQDIQNEAAYHTSGRNSGFSSSLKDLPKAALQTIPSMAIPVQGQADSVTRSAIAESVIIEAEHSNREAINRDTQGALNKLETIFDKKSVEERIELTNSIARNGAKLIGDIAAKKAWDAQVKALQETDPVKRAKYEREVKQWSDGGVNKIALHSVLGGFVSSLAGGTISTGALSAGANEALQGQLGKIKDPNLHRLASTMIGRVVTQSATGGAIAENATIHNYLTHEQISNEIEELKQAKTQEEIDAILLKYDALNQQQEVEYEKVYNKYEKYFERQGLDLSNPILELEIIKRTISELGDSADLGSIKSVDLFNPKYTPDSIERIPLYVFGTRVVEDKSKKNKTTISWGSYETVIDNAILKAIKEGNEGLALYTKAQEYIYQGIKAEDLKQRDIVSNQKINSYNKDILLKGYDNILDLGSDENSLDVLVNQTLPELQKKGMEATYLLTKIFVEKDRYKLRSLPDIKSIQTIGSVDNIEFTSSSTIGRLLKNDNNLQHNILKAAQNLAKEKGLDLKYKSVRVEDSFWLGPQRDLSLKAIGDGALSGGHITVESVVSFDDKKNSYIIESKFIDKWDNDYTEALVSDVITSALDEQLVDSATGIKGSVLKDSSINSIAHAYNLEQHRVRIPYLWSVQLDPIEIKE